MISRKLLGAILDADILSVNEGIQAELKDNKDNEVVYFKINEHYGKIYEINIYSVANKIKKWASLKGVVLRSRPRKYSSKDFLCDVIDGGVVFNSECETEYEAIIKAGEYVLKNYAGGEDDK